MRKRLKDHVWIILMTFMITGALVLSGCSGTSGETTGKTGGKETQDTYQSTGETGGSFEEGSTQAQADPATGAVGDTEEGDGAPDADVSSASEGNSPAQDTQTDPKTTGTIEDNKTTEIKTGSDEAGEAPVKAEDSAEALGKSEAGEKTGSNGTEIILAADDDSTWANSFLLFLPRYKGGVEEDRICEETFDHIVIGGIESKRDIEDYVEEIKAAGFDVDADYVDHNGEIDFHAYNSDGWYVTVDYDIKTAKVDIGCGFFAQPKEKEPGNYFDEEILEVLPLPEAGTLSSGRSDGDYPYVLYEECTLEDARTYAGKLKKAGFDSEVMEGESGDLYWYNALGPDGMICDMQYSDGIIMIGCDRAEE